MTLYMSHDSKRPQRRSIRLQDYDYTREGIYFVTLCAYQRQCFFGEVGDGATIFLNTIGCVVAEEWERTPQIRPYVVLDEFVVMPNHLHGIIQIDGRRTGLSPTNPYRSTRC